MTLLADNLCLRLLETAKPEELFSFRGLSKRWATSYFLYQEHFNFMRFFQQAVFYQFQTGRIIDTSNTRPKWVVYSRNCNALLQADSKNMTDALSNWIGAYITQQGCPTVKPTCLSTLIITQSRALTASYCTNFVKEFADKCREDSDPKILLVVVDLTTTTSSQVVWLQDIIDELVKQPNVLVFIVLDCPADQKFSQLSQFVQIQIFTYSY